MSSGEPRLLTIAMAIYGQPLMLKVWLDTLRSYPEEIRDRIELIVVDDCGDPPAEVPLDIHDLLPVQVFRVTEDIPWNQPGARNLAIEHTRTPLILFVDPDMVFPTDMMHKMLRAGSQLELGQVIRFQLQHRQGPSLGFIDSSSPNTWFLHVSDFQSIGCYDEDYCGHKGWSDVQLLDIMKSAYKVFHRADLFAQFYSTREVDDAMVKSLDRDVKFNKWNRRLPYHKLAVNTGGYAKFARKIVALKKRLRFKWEQVL